MPRIHVFTDADLDGAGSYLALKLAYKNADISYSVTTEKNFRENILNWQLKDSFKNYDTVFICDLNIKNDIALIDRDNVVVFDHHAEHVNHLNEYVKAKAIIKEYPSCTLLMYHSLKLKEKITDHQKLLFNFISDYDSYVLKIAPTGLNVSAVTNNDNFTIFPTPADNIFTIDLGTASSANIKIIDLHGRLVYETNTKNIKHVFKILSSFSFFSVLKCANVSIITPKIKFKTMIISKI